MFENRPGPLNIRDSSSDRDKAALCCVGSGFDDEVEFLMDLVSVSICIFARPSGSVEEAINKCCGKQNDGGTSQNESLKHI
jgi:hypothetical protein